jgi:hypothetical protein
MAIEHLTIQDRGLKSYILGIGAANDAWPGQFYLAENTNEYFYGAQDGSLIGPLLTAASEYISSHTDTATVDLNVTAGALTANVKLSAVAGQHLTAQADGIHAKALSIHTDSTAFAEIDVNYQLKFKQLLITQNTVDPTNSTLAAHLTAVGYNSGNLIYQESDMIILTTSHETWIQNGGNAGTTADFTKVSADVTDSYIRNLFSGVSGVSYNPGTGVFSLATNGVLDTHIRQSVARSVIGRSANTDGNVANIQSTANGHFLVQRTNALTFGLLEAGDIPAVAASKWTTTGSDIYRNSSVRIGSTTAPDGKLAITMPGGAVKNRAISITRDSGWSNSYIDSFATTSPAQRGFIIGGQNNVGTEVDLIWIDTYLQSIGFGQVPQARYDFAINEGINFRWSRSGNTEHALVNLNNSGDLIFRNTTGHYSFGRVADSLGGINPSANIHLFSPGAVSQESVFILEKAGGYGQTVFNTYYAASNNRGVRIALDGGAALLTLRGSDGGFSGHAVGVKTDSPLYDFHVTGNSYSSNGLWVGGGTVTMAAGVITAQNGFRINNAAASGQYLRGNGSNFVSSALLASDLSGGVPIANGGTGQSGLGTALQVLRTNATMTGTEWATIAPASYTFNNGLSESGGIVKFGGTAFTENRTLDIANFNWHVARGTGKVTFFNGTAGPSAFNIYNQDLEIISVTPWTALNGLIMYDDSGNRRRLTLRGNRLLVSDPL